MAVPAPNHAPSGPPAWRRSFFGGVVHGSAFAVHNALVDPNSVLPAFVAGLTPARAVVGLVSAILIGGEYLLQLLFAYLLQGLPRRKPYLLAAVAVRAAAWALLGALTYGLPGLPSGLLLGLFLVMVALYATTGGLGGVAFADIVGGAIPPTVRGRFYATRQFLGSLLAFGSGYAARQILGPAGPAFPANYGLLFLLSGLTLFVGVLGFALMAEEPRQPAARLPIGNYLGQSLGLVRQDSRFRSLLVMQVAAGAAMMAVPFYILYAREQLGLGAGVVGLAVAAQVAGGALSNVFWGLLRDRFGSLAAVRGALLLDLIIPPVALALGALAPRIFPLLFVLVGASHHGRKLGFFNCLIDLSPPQLRPTYAGLNGTLTSPLLLFPLVGGLLAGVWGYQPLFVATALVGLIPLMVAWQLNPVPPRH